MQKMEGKLLPRSQRQQTLDFYTCSSRNKNISGGSEREVRKRDGARRIELAHKTARYARKKAPRSVRLFFTWSVLCIKKSKLVALLRGVVVGGVKSGLEGFVLGFVVLMKALNFPHLRAAHLSCLFYCNFALQLQLPLNFAPLRTIFQPPINPFPTPLTMSSDYVAQLAAVLETGKLFCFRLSQLLSLTGEWGILVKPITF